MAGLLRRWFNGSRFLLHRLGRGTIHVLVGAALGMLVLHPITMVVYWFEFHMRVENAGASLWRFAGDRLVSSFTWEMFPMSVVFAGIGGAFGAVYALLNARIRSSARVISHLEREAGRDVPTLIRLGENEHVEFKASARWDAKRNQVNKTLGGVIARTVAALANLDGGDAVGIAEDYRTLKKPGRDGFAQYVMSLVRERLGADLCRFFVRTGNGTSELDARETVCFVAARWDRGNSPRHRHRLESDAGSRRARRKEYENDDDT